MYIWGNLKSGKILILPHVKYWFQNPKSLQYQKKKKKLKPSSKHPEIKLKMNNFTGHHFFLDREMLLPVSSRCHKKLRLPRITTLHS